MVRLFILIRRKGSKRFLGAIPTRKGATMASLRRVRIKGFVFRIVTEKQLRRIILKQRPRGVRRLRKRGIRRKVRRTRRIGKRRFKRRTRRVKRKRRRVRSRRMLRKRARRIRRRRKR